MIRVLDGIALYAIYGIVGLIPLAILPVAGFTLWETPKVAVLNIFSLL
ncbi:MAG: hypothetical protein HYY29_05770, partial [Chloroflexi bacterium]|nr:hypothetical protein [Chloroflexota bacterium]